MTELQYKIRRQLRPKLSAMSATPECQVSRWVFVYFLFALISSHLPFRPCLSVLGKVSFTWFAFLHPRRAHMLAVGKFA